MSDPLSAARELSPLAASTAAHAETDRRLDATLVEGMREAGLFRLCVPRAAGGLEAHPQVLVDCIEELAAGDAAAGWCVAVSATAGMLAAWLDPAAAREVYGPPGNIVGGVFAPAGTATPRDGGHEVSGRWQFCSNAENCDWLMGGCPDDGGVRLFLFPRESVQIHDTWHVSGLRATGSHDIEVSGVTVPTGLSASLGSERPHEEGPLYAFPPFATLALSIAAVAIGTARGAVADLVELAGAKRPAMSTRSLATRAHTQSSVARSAAALGAAHALVVEQVAGAWEEAGRGEVGLERRAALRMAATHATRAAAEAVDAMYELGGGSSIYESSALQRRFRDVHAATQHMIVGSSTWELAGRVLLGLDTDASQL